MTSRREDLGLCWRIKTIQQVCKTQCTENIVESIKLENDIIEFGASLVSVEPTIFIIDIAAQAKSDSTDFSIKAFPKRSKK